MSSSAPGASIDTAQVPHRRPLRFNSIDEVILDVDRLVEAERKGRLKRLGNWTLGQTLGHLATWAGFAFTPNPLKPPFFVRWIVRMRKSRYINESLPAGVRIPRVEGGTLGTKVISLEEGVRLYREALLRLKRDPPTQVNTLFGRLTHDEWINLNLRHAELHLGFMVPQ